MKTRILQNALMCLLLLACVSCNSLFWKNDPLLLVRDDACEAPCWQGITPGVTTFDEAKMLAQNVAINISDNEVVVPEKITINYDMPYLVIPFEKPSVAVHVYVDDQNVVKWIIFNFARKNRPELGELIQIFGEPEKIGLCHWYFEIRQATVHVSYPQIDMFFDRKLSIDGEKFSVPYSLETPIDYLLYRASPEIPPLDFTFPWAESGVLEFSPEEYNPASICSHP